MKRFTGPLLLLATLTSFSGLGHGATPRAAEDAASPVTSTDALPPRAITPRPPKAAPQARQQPRGKASPAPKPNKPVRGAGKSPKR